MEGKWRKKTEGRSKMELAQASFWGPRGKAKKKNHAGGWESSMFGGAIFKHHSKVNLSPFHHHPSVRKWGCKVSNLTRVTTSPTHLPNAQPSSPQGNPFFYSQLTGSILPLTHDICGAPEWFIEQSFGHCFFPKP